MSCNIYHLGSQATTPLCPFSYPSLGWGFGFRPRKDSVCGLVRDRTEFYMEPLEEQGVEAEPGARWVIVGIWAFY